MPPVSRPEYTLVANGTKFSAPSALPSLKGSSSDRPLPHVRGKKAGRKGKRNQEAPSSDSIARGAKV